MASQAHNHILIYNSIDKVQAYWNSFKPAAPAHRDYLSKWLSSTAIFDTISFQSHVCVFLWDVVSNRIVYAADRTKVLGDHAAKLTEEDGVDYSVSLFHPEHLEPVLMLQKTGIDYCVAHPELLPGKIMLNLDCLYSKYNGYAHILQQGVPVETDDNHHPLLFLSFVYDISHLKKSNSAGFAITTPQQTLLYKFSTGDKIAEEIKPFTATERSILKMLGDGKSTKQIAGELSVSPYTVDTHRGNMLSKTNCVDTTALVTYCRMIGVL